MRGSTVYTSLINCTHNIVGLTGFLISVGLALGVRVGIQKLGNFGRALCFTSLLVALSPLVVDGLMDVDVEGI